MARQNRVLPTGAIVAHPARGLFMGNRGCLHDAGGRIVRHARGRRWICCLTAFRGRRRPLMAPGQYTELFFLDEAVALAAGHRPCAECRRADYEAFRDAWVAAFGGPRPAVDAIDRALEADRGGPAPGPVAAASLPEGAFARDAQGAVLLVWRARLRPFTPDGYGPPAPVAGLVSPLTSRTIRAALAAGYRPRVHDSAS